MYYHLKYPCISNIQWPSLGMPACRRCGTSVMMSRRYLDIRNFSGNWRKSLKFWGIRHLKFKNFLGRSPRPPQNVTPLSNTLATCLSVYITDDTLNQNYRRALPNSKNSDLPNISIGAHTILRCEIAETSHYAVRTATSTSDGPAQK